MKHTVLIRAVPGGTIWEAYHVKELETAAALAQTAIRRGFESVNVIDYDPQYEETFPGWWVKNYPKEQR